MRSSHRCPVHVPRGAGTDIVELDQGAKLGVVHEMFVQHLCRNAGRSFGEVLHLYMPVMLDCRGMTVLWSSEVSCERVELGMDCAVVV